MTGIDTGGDTILSYNLEYDEGTNGVSWVSLMGLTSNSLALTFIQTGLTISTNYKFRY